MTFNDMGSGESYKQWAISSRPGKKPPSFFSFLLFFSVIFYLFWYFLFFFYNFKYFIYPLGTNRSLTVKPNEGGGLCMSMWTWHSVSQIPPSIIHQSRPVGEEYADHFEAATWNGPAHAD